MTPLRALPILVALCLAAGLAACEKQVEAPRDVGVCWGVATLKDGTLKFNKVADKQPTIEYCAVELEKVRLNFIRLGSSNREMVGAYQGNFIWVNPRGVFIAQSLKGQAYPSLFRGEDGRLIIPGSKPATPAGQ